MATFDSWNELIQDLEDVQPISPAKELSFLRSILKLMRRNRERPPIDNSFAKEMKRKYSGCNHEQLVNATERIMEVLVKQYKKVRLWRDDRLCTYHVKEHYLKIKIVPKMERPLPTHFFPPMIIHDGLAPFCHEIQYYENEAETSENRPPPPEEFDWTVRGESYIVPDTTPKEKETDPKPKKQRTPRKTREKLLELVKICTDQIENFELDAEEFGLNDDYRFEQFEENRDYSQDPCWLKLHKDLRR
ncbi:unnamed protein product [Bursaphelenchus xylophilus]|uniref:(pine wood nematode) hypothetical protein n=1 Tax=Bursaphelenchus xylophilus TaxID=6326 RepID=A0A1I7RZT6_BURXY|nr:unnamed protein product [Bursaphelenchus xylophilus]CAG9109248.1 unnamed protein product [Bursaphelenchus xylophilus]